MARHWLLNTILLAITLAQAACGGSGSSTPPPAVIEGSGVDRIDNAMRAVMDRHDPPGISVAVGFEDRLVFARAYGSADLAGKEPLNTRHAFRVASVSKPITGIAALKAVDEGLLDLDAAAFDILSAYLPDAGADPRLADITVRHLTHHLSGWTLWDYPSDPLFRSAEIATELDVAMPPDPHALTRWVARQPLTNDPGTRVAYTNIGFIVLGRVLEASTGFDYEDFVQRFVMEPAGISSAALGGATRAERLPNEVEYESFRDEIWTSVFDGSTVLSEPAYGGLNLAGFDASSAWVMTPADLVRLVAAVDNDPAYPDILSGDSMATMTQVGTPAGDTALGIAWFLAVDATGNTIAYDHAGGMPGTTAFLGRTRSGAIVAVISNTARDQGFFDDLASGVVDAVEGITDWPSTDLFPQF